MNAAPQVELNISKRRKKCQSITNDGGSTFSFAGDADVEEASPRFDRHVRVNGGYTLRMNVQPRRRTAALFEVFGVYLTGAFLSSQVIALLIRWHRIPAQNPLTLRTPHTTNTELLAASWQLLLTLVVVYGSYFTLIIPINLWYRRTGPADYGLTSAGRPWKGLILAGLATACLTQWPVLVHSLVDAIHPLGAMVPWRQGFFTMSWHRWQFWLFSGILSYAFVPVVEELMFRGYCQRRLAEDWGNGSAVIGTACLFTFAHSQYLIANAYNITMIVSLFCMALGLGIVFAWTRSLIPSIVAHALINIPMTPLWQGVLLVLFVIGIYFARRGGIKAVKAVCGSAGLAACILLAVLETAYALSNGRIPGLRYLAMGMLLIALVLEAIDRRKKPNVRLAAADVSS